MISNPRTVNIFGATGSVGQRTLEILESAGQPYQINALTANDDYEALARLARRHTPKKIILANKEKINNLNQLLGDINVSVSAGREALLQVAQEPVDWTMAAISGMAGLEPLYHSIRHSKIVAIANKEPLVAAGPLIMKLATEKGTKLLPVDSEHNALFQLLEGSQRAKIKDIVLTASGGPFLKRDLNDFDAITPEEAVAHPQWSMGAKISVDSATLMNKALEVIEAAYFFNFKADQVRVRIHPQSLIHAMLMTEAGDCTAHLSAPDMGGPIAHAWHWPESGSSDAKKLTLSDLNDLTFKDVCSKRFPALKLAYEALNKGLYACIAMNAANEIAVHAFLNGNIAFTAIVPAVAKIMKAAPEKEFGAASNVKSDINAICAYDKDIRAMTESYLDGQRQNGDSAETQKKTAIL